MIHVKELDRMVAFPDVPASYSTPGKRAFERGVIARCWVGKATQNPYKVRHMRDAWTAGYDAAATEIRRVGEQEV